MKFSTGKTARAIRRRELIALLLTLSEALQPEHAAKAKMYVLELNDLMVVEANTSTRPRARKRL